MALDMSNEGIRVALAQASLAKDSLWTTRYLSPIRLLEFDSCGDLCFTKYFIDKIPAYAILSHTWGADEDEVTFDDVRNGSGSSKAGCTKIQFCGQQAKKNGLQCFWVDTCCIDKGSTAEISEALSSMYAWCRKAKLCYVYLEDIVLEHGPELLHFSKWFSRGWTLQVFIAPSFVQFYDRNWEFIGDKMSFSSEVSLNTDIDCGALETGNRRKYSVAQNMSWASGRLTTRVESTANCLMGLFDINMPPSYREGTKAFRQLQEEIIRPDDDHTIFAWSMDTEIYSMTISGGVKCAKEAEYTVQHIITRFGHYQNLWTRCHTSAVVQPQWVYPEAAP